MKNVYCVSTKRHGDIKLSVLRSKTQPFCLAQTCEILTIPTDT